MQIFSEVGTWIIYWNLRLEKKKILNINAQKEDKPELGGLNWVACSVTAKFYLCS